MRLPLAVEHLPHSDGDPEASNGSLVVIYEVHDASMGGGGRRKGKKGSGGERNGRSGCWLAVLDVMWVERPSARVVVVGGKC